MVSFTARTLLFGWDPRACVLEPTRSDEGGCEGWRGSSVPREVVAAPGMGPHCQVSVSLASYKGLR